jgi:predicted ATPase
MLRSLGGLRLEPATFSQPKPLLLLAYLSLEGAQARRHLAELFWPEGHRLKSLSMTLTRLRQGAGDVVAADELRAWATPASDTAELIDALDAGDWGRAVELYTGAFLDGVVLDDWSSELEEWVYATREHLARRVQQAYVNLAEGAAAREAFADAADLAARGYRLPGAGAAERETLRRLYVVLSAGEHPRAADVLRELQEFAHADPVAPDAARAALRSGRRAAPHNLVARGTTFVGREAELARLAELVGRPGVRLVTVVGPGGVGKSRLAQEFARAQARGGRYPDGVFVASLDSVAHPDQLPIELLSIVGLRPEADVDPWTTLANGLAERRMLLVLDDFEALAPAAAKLPGLLAAAPGVDLVVTSRVRLGVAEEHLAPLDGMALPPAGRVSWAEAQRFEAVRLFAERARRLKPDVAFAEEADHVVAVCRRLRGLPLGLELAAAWVRVLSCSEIAAEIERNLDFLVSTAPDLPERHRSVRAMIEVSWRLLSEREREAMRRLAVFRGGFRREAAALVADAPLSVLVGLVDASLLRQSGHGRFDRHPLVAQFTLEQLERSPEAHADAAGRHAAHLLDFVEEADGHLRSRDQVAWFGRLDEEMENARAALDHVEATGDAERALRLAVALTHYAQTRGEQRPALQRLSRALERLDGADALQGGDPRTGDLRARALRLAGDCAWRLGEHERAEAHYRACLALTEDGAHDDERVEALLGLASVYRANRGDTATARAHARSALDLARRSGGPRPLGHALRSLGTLDVEAADYAAAKRHYEASVDVFESIGDPVDQARSNLSLATVLAYLGEHERAGRLNRAALALFRAVGDRHGEAMAQLNLGVAASRSGDGRTSIRCYRASLSAYRDLGDARMVSHLLNNLGAVLQTMGRPRMALPFLEGSLALQRRVGDASLLSHALFVQAQVLMDLGRRDDAHATFVACIDICRAHEENWALMRALEHVARWHLEAGDRAAAIAALDEAERIATRAGDRATLAKVAETRARIGGAAVA